MVVSLKGVEGTAIHLTIYFKGKICTPYWRFRRSVHQMREVVSLAQCSTRLDLDVDPAPRHDVLSAYDGRARLDPLQRVLVRYAVVAIHAGRQDGLSLLALRQDLLEQLIWRRRVVTSVVPDLQEADRLYRKNGVIRYG